MFKYNKSRPKPYTIDLLSQNNAYSSFAGGKAPRSRFTFRNPMSSLARDPTAYPGRTFKQSSREPSTETIVEIPDHVHAVISNLQGEIAEVREELKLEKEHSRTLTFVMNTIKTGFQDLVNVMKPHTKCAEEAQTLDQPKGPEAILRAMLAEKKRVEEQQTHLQQRVSAAEEAAKEAKVEAQEAERVKTMKVEMCAHAEAQLKDVQTELASQKTLAFTCEVETIRATGDRDAAQREAAQLKEELQIKDQMISELQIQLARFADAGRRLQDISGLIVHEDGSIHRPIEHLASPFGIPALGLLADLNSFTRTHSSSPPSSASTLVEDPSPHADQSPCIKLTNPFLVPSKESNEDAQLPNPFLVAPKDDIDEDKRPLRNPFLIPPKDDKDEDEGKVAPGASEFCLPESTLQDTPSTAHDSSATSNRERQLRNAQQRMLGRSGNKERAEMVKMIKDAKTELPQDRRAQRAQRLSKKPY